MNIYEEKIKTAVEMCEMWLIREKKLDCFGNEMITELEQAIKEGREALG